MMKSGVAGPLLRPTKSLIKWIKNYKFISDWRLMLRPMNFRMVKILSKSINWKLFCFIDPIKYCYLVLTWGLTPNIFRLGGMFKSCGIWMWPKSTVKASHQIPKCPMSKTVRSPGNVRTSVFLSYLRSGVSLPFSSATRRPWGDGLGPLPTQNLASGIGRSHWNFESMAKMKNHDFVYDRLLSKTWIKININEVVPYQGCNKSSFHLHNIEMFRMWNIQCLPHLKSYTAVNCYEKTGEVDNVF